jgi:hypothetical protein
MQLTVKKPVTINADAIRCILPVRYGEEDIPNDFPGRKGDVLTLTLDLNTGRAREWKPEFGESEVQMEVCDEGTYILLDGQAVVAKIEQNYVPDCVPGEFCDYVAFKIRADGTLVDWDPDAKTIAEAFFRQDDIARSLFGWECPLCGERMSLEDYDPAEYEDEPEREEPEEDDI